MRGQVDERELERGVFETRHAVTVGDARSLPLPDDSVELVVTSPPYPMIEQWDALYESLSPGVTASLEAGDGRGAFEQMHETLDAAWDEIERVLVDGGIACVNVGDATRRVGDRYQLYPNHARVTAAFTSRGFRQLPGILWRKPTNRPAKFLGSGTLPPNAYVTLEHEHLLVFRNGGGRALPSGDERRYQAAYFWEERNEWFSDTWELSGASQTTEIAGRDRRAAFPVVVPYRLICMFSVYGDTVLDPFWGTGTTTLAAMQAGRDSVGVESESAAVASFDPDGVAAASRARVRDRLDRHRTFAPDRETAHDARYYDFGVYTRQERSIRLYAVDDVVCVPGGYHARHVAVDDTDDARPD